MTPCKGFLPFCGLPVCSPRGQRWRIRPFSGYPKTIIFLLAMVIRIVMTIASKKMTIAAPLKTVLEKAENRAEKGTECPYSVKGCYFCGPRKAPRRPRRPRNQSWFDEFFRKLRPVERPLRLYIYAKRGALLHKYTGTCKYFSHPSQRLYPRQEPCRFPQTSAAPHRHGLHRTWP